MHIHYFQHDDFEDLAYIGNWAAERGFSTSLTRFDLGHDLPLLDSLDWLVVLGGKMGAYDESKYPWLCKEKEFIRDAIAAGKIVIGICLGSQLIASSLGSEVYRNTQAEVGFFPVFFNENAKADPVFMLFGNELPVLHVHDDTFDLPEGAVLMASSVLTRNQAFRYNKNVFAFQFHFEVSQDRVPLFLRAAGGEPGEWKQSPDKIMELSANCPFNNEIFNTVLTAILTTN
jgi:GMP synthase-like glutamine amidotransferase